jgi:DNA-binding CsgD family transcriptional regulator
MAAVSSGDAHQLLLAGQWAEAAAAFERRLLGGDDASSLEGLGLSRWWLDDGDGCLAAREDAYRAYREAGDDRGAARVATSLAWDAVLFGQGAAISRGWFARASELLRPLAPSSEHGWLAIREAELAFNVGRDAAAARGAALHAERLGQQLGDIDLEIAGRAYSGLASVALGEVADGMVLLDSAVTAATAGDVDDLMWMGKICCWLIVACRQTQDLDRAAAWCERVERLARERGLSPLTAECRIQHATVQMFRGVWTDAESQLTDLVARLSTSRRDSRFEAIAELGELRRRQGRSAEADDLLRQAEFQTTAIIGRAWLRLARGQAESAWSLSEGLVSRTPVTSTLARADVLPVAVASAVATGRSEIATRFARELSAAAELAGTVSLRGFAAVARAEAGGRNGVADGQDAVRLFSMVGLGYEQGRARLVLADRLKEAGDLPGAEEQLRAAADEFDALGAAADAETARRRLPRVSGIDGLTPRQREVLRLVADGKTNAEIAALLFLSEHTVHRHVANILGLLGLRSRAGAAAFAVANSLI